MVFVAQIYRSVPSRKRRIVDRTCSGKAEIRVSESVCGPSNCDARNKIVQERRMTRGCRGACWRTNLRRLCSAQGIRATRHRLVAAAARPDADGNALDAVLAAKDARVLRVLADIVLLHDLAQRRAIAKTVLAGDTRLLGALRAPRQETRRSEPRLCNQIARRLTGLAWHRGTYLVDHLLLGLTKVLRSRDDGTGKFTQLLRGGAPPWGALPNQAAKRPPLSHIWKEARRCRCRRDRGEPLPCGHVGLQKDLPT